MKPKDYYAMLEVNKHTSKEEIKANYRKLAKKYHPDANINDPSAEERFKDLTVAYDTLMDKDKRKKYDKQTLRYGYGIAPKKLHKFEKLQDIKYVVKNPNKVASEVFNTIIGFGKDAKEAVVNTAGDIREKMQAKKEAKKGENIEATLEISLEEGFFGAEKKLSLKTVGGKISNYTVSVPKGIRDAEKIRLAALGKPGKNGGKNGDLIITVKIKQHPFICLDGADVLANIDISYVQSIVGDKMFIKIFGEQVEVNIPEKTKEQDKILIPKKGYVVNDNTRGNLIVTVHIKQAEEITERERKIYEQLLRVEKQKIKNAGKN